MGDPPVKDETAGGGEKESTPSPPPLCWEGRALEARVLLLWCVQSCDLRVSSALLSVKLQEGQRPMSSLYRLCRLPKGTRRQGARGTVMNLMNPWEEMEKREPSSGPGAISAGERGSSPQGGQE